VIQLRQDTATLKQRYVQMSRASILSPPTIQSTGNPSKWGLGDLAALKQVTNLVAKEADHLQGLNKDFAAQMTELQPGTEKCAYTINEYLHTLIPFISTSEAQ
jgi:hypothetical protein